LELEVCFYVQPLSKLYIIVYDMHKIVKQLTSCGGEKLFMPKHDIYDCTNDYVYNHIWHLWQLQEYVVDIFLPNCEILLKTKNH
jgi:hypothetical protein